MKDNGKYFKVPDEINDPCSLHPHFPLPHFQSPLQWITLATECNDRPIWHGEPMTILLLPPHSNGIFAVIAMRTASC